MGIVLPFLLFAQTWKNTIDLNLTVDDADRIDLYTNADGNHVILQTSSQLKYYLFSYNGTQVRTVTIDNNVSEYPRLSCISGDPDTIIVLWKEGSYIYGKRTADAGQNWASITSIELDQDYSNGLEVWPTDYELHVVWSESESASGNSYESYHRPLTYSGTWGTKKQVTDYSGKEGGFPSVTTSANRVHVAYTFCSGQSPIGNYGISDNRDRYNSTTWQDPILIFNQASRSHLIADNAKLHAFYYKVSNDEEEEEFFHPLFTKKRDLSGTTWDSEIRLIDNCDPEERPVDCTLSHNNHVHMVYEGKYYREWDGSSWSDATTFSSASWWELFFQQIAANSNDIYVLWIELDGNDFKLKLKQRDYAPLAPQNLYVDFNVNNHPTVHWDANTEADLKGYHVYRDIPAISSSQRLTSTPITATYYVDDEYIQGESYQAYYYAKAVDQYDNLSPSSNYDVVWVMPTKAGYVIRSGSLVPGKYDLKQNYPNPFNPTTTIAFDLPQECRVMITIYDLAGRKVRSLWNGSLPAGSHRVEWHGDNDRGVAVAGGVYLYRLTAGEFTAIRKMILMR